MGGSSYDVIGGMNECNAHMYEGLPTKLKQRAIPQVEASGSTFLKFLRNAYLES